MAIADNYTDLSDNFILDVTSRLAAELGPIFQARHMTAVAQALTTVQTATKLAQKELSVSSVKKARA